MHLPMTNRVDEVQTTVNPMVFYVPTVQPWLITQVLIIFLIDIVNDRLPATRVRRRFKINRCSSQLYLPGPVVNCISKSWSVHNSQPQLDSFLLNVHCCSINTHSLLDTLCIIRNLITISVAMFQRGIRETFILIATKNQSLHSNDSVLSTCKAGNQNTAEGASQLLATTHR